MADQALEAELLVVAVDPVGHKPAVRRSAAAHALRVNLGVRVLDELEARDDVAERRTAPVLLDVVAELLAKAGRARAVDADGDCAGVRVKPRRQLVARARRQGAMR